MKFTADLSFTRMRPGAVPDGPLHMPKKSGDIGYDLQILEDTVCLPGHLMYIRTGVHVQCERGLWYSIAARSSLTKRGGFIPFNVIDSDYQGELLIGVFNTAAEALHLQANERIAQLVFFKTVHPVLQTVQEYDIVGERGANGFGSTGR